MHGEHAPGKTYPSRRAVICSVVAATFAAEVQAEASAADIDLVTLGREFDEVAAQLDHSIEHDIDLPDEVHERFGQIWDAIEATPATTVEGLQVKARLACWCLLGDLDTPEKTTGDREMAYSILRDLIRMHRPELEKPGALTKLVQEIETGAG